MAASRIRRFSFVFHDVQKGTKSKSELFDFCLRTFSPSEMVIAEEPYNHQDGSHIHVFINMKNPRRFFETLQLCQVFWPHGRVQVDRAYGTMVQGCKYLQDAPKDKAYDMFPMFYPSRSIELTDQQKADQFFKDLSRRMNSPRTTPLWVVELSARLSSGR